LWLERRASEEADERRFLKVVPSLSRMPHCYYTWASCVCLCAILFVCATAQPDFGGDDQTPPKLTPETRKHMACLGSHWVELMLFVAKSLSINEAPFFSGSPRHQCTSQLTRPRSLQGCCGRYREKLQQPQKESFNQRQLCLHPRYVWMLVVAHLQFWVFIRCRCDRSSGHKMFLHSLWEVLQSFWLCWFNGRGTFCFVVCQTVNSILPSVGE